MIIYLRYNTDSQTRKLPPFVDSTDGNSEETGLTIANTDILIGKPGATSLTAKHSGGATHISNGIYYATFDSSDSDTIGNGELYIHKSGALFCFATLIILPQKVYDAMFGSDNLEVDVVLWNGSSLPTIPSAAPTVGEIRTELATELGRIDATVSSRLAASGYVAPDNAGIAALPTLAEIEGSEVLAMAADLPSEAPTAEAIRTEIDANSTQLAAIRAKTNSLPAIWCSP